MFKKIIFLLLVVASSVGFAKEVDDAFLKKMVENWESLTPPGAYDFIPEKVSYKLLSDPDFQANLDAAGRKINPLVQGRDIELAGFMVPIEIQGNSVTKFLLVPEAGQCIHVPPPPVNQTLLVDMTHNPTKLKDIYDPIIVAGRVDVGVQSVDISQSITADTNQDANGSQSYENIDSGYSLSAATVEELIFKEESK